MKLITIGYSLVIACVVAFAALLFLSLVSIPGINIDVRVVQTGSMEPAIKTGSIVVIQPQELYTEGDVITFRRADQRDDTPITHRIVSVRVESGEYIYTTKGDANEVQDLNEVRAAEVLGKVSFTVPYVGYLLTAARTPYGFTALIVLPALLIIVDEVKKILREVRKARRKEEESDEQTEQDMKASTTDNTDTK